jgi:hypothetical protein
LFNARAIPHVLAKEPRPGKFLKLPRSFDRQSPDFNAKPSIDYHTWGITV